MERLSAFALLVMIVLKGIKRMILRFNPLSKTYSIRPRIILLLTKNQHLKGKGCVCWLAGCVKQRSEPLKCVKYELLFPTGKQCFISCNPLYFHSFDA